MRKKFTIEEAKEIAEKLKKKYKFGTKSCPSWFKNTCVAMEQDGNYSVCVCIPSWSAIKEEEGNVFLEPFEGMHIHLRIVTPTPIYDFSKKKKDEVKDEKKKKRRPNRKGYR